MTTQRSEPVSKTERRQEDQPNLSGALSDYGRDAYASGIKAQAMQSESSAAEKYDRSQQLEQVSEGKGIGKGLLLLGGAGVSAALIYWLRPGQKKGEQTLKQDELWQAKCRDVMTEDPSCCLPADGVNKAAQLMKTKNVGAIPVVDDLKTKRLIGIVTDRDLALKVIAEGLNSQNTSVADVMTTNVTACRPGDDLEKALTEMSDRQLRRILVVDDNRRIVGIIAQADIATRLDAPRKTAEVVEEISKTAAASAG